jgi:hypothetical protein
VALFVAVTCSAERTADLDRQRVDSEILLQVAEQPRHRQAREAPALAALDPLDARDLPPADHWSDDHDVGCGGWWLTLRFGPP